MKAAVLTGLVFSVGLAAPPGVAADCVQIEQSLNALSATISRDADAYWAQRRAYIDSKAARPRNPADTARASQLAAAAEGQADTLRRAMPKTLARFAAMANSAKKQQCLTPQKLHELREATFDKARRVDFDNLPEEETTEGGKSLPTTPRMPVK